MKQSRGWLRLWGRRSPFLRLLLLLFSGFLLAVFKNLAFTLNSMDLQNNGPKDLLIVGCGYLGHRLAEQWLQATPDARVIGITLTHASHADMRSIGIEPQVLEEFRKALPKKKFNYVVFSVPPFRDGASVVSYAEIASEALSSWAGPRGGLEGGFVFTSSGSVFAENAGGEVNETSPVSNLPSSAVILEVERQVRAMSGTVLRLAGLYDAFRGPHAFWLKSGVIRGDPMRLLNLVHYNDAASAVILALKRGPSVRDKVLLICDGSPVSPADIVEAMRTSQLFSSSNMPTFEDGVPTHTSSAKPKAGRIYRTLAALRELGWVPRCSSFVQYMHGHISE